MNSKMTTNDNLQLSTTETKKHKNKVSKQLEQEQNHRSGDHMEGYHRGSRRGRKGKEEKREKDQSAPLSSLSLSSKSLFFPLLLFPPLPCPGNHDAPLSCPLAPKASWVDFFGCWNDGHRKLTAEALPGHSPWPKGTGSPEALPYHQGWPTLAAAQWKDTEMLPLPWFRIIQKGHLSSEPLIAPPESFVTPAALPLPSMLAYFLKGAGRALFSELPACKRPQFPSKDSKDSLFLFLKSLVSFHSLSKKALSRKKKPLWVYLLPKDLTLGWICLIFVISYCKDPAQDPVCNCLINKRCQIYWYLVDEYL